MSGSNRAMEFVYVSSDAAAKRITLSSSEILIISLIFERAQYHLTHFKIRYFAATQLYLYNYNVEDAAIHFVANKGL